MKFGEEHQFGGGQVASTVCIARSLTSGRYERVVVEFVDVQLVDRQRLPHIPLPRGALARPRRTQDGRCRNILTPSPSRCRTKRHLTKSKLRYRSKFTANFRVHIILAMKILLKNTALRLHIDLCLNTLVQKLTEV
jgi:hypothetical protein